MWGKVVKKVDLLGCVWIYMTISLKQINIVGLTENQNNPKHTVDSKNQKKKGTQM